MSDEHFVNLKFNVILYRYIMLNYFYNRVGFSN